MTKNQRLLATKRLRNLFFQCPHHIRMLRPQALRTLRSSSVATQTYYQKTNLQSPLNAVSVFSDSTSVVVRGSLLFDRERTSTSSELDMEPQIHISETELVSGGWKEEPLRSSTRSTLSESSSASSVSEGDKKDLKVWLQRSPKSIERALS
ncbi:hypothetical protein BDP27DRAFT_1053072 [Rhodocollybia butyracea]|uniref:Uncharacterized protein n=1 Tax=Rhodocollybia butyracea TaxID=206335 RepID=A0A9P5TV54_9AGAR|nr:hypothetical protein BDP27DRAFT_1053072 [Rhodocollybia butyracea]